ncbi:Aldo/keto reductase [Clathrospora elynae]|uniref:Aldo/keto reductase n=1 Tax=Clathrospora elynae TaxID=706981 RepID=A0A6A5SV10_9PLEO|nr:Aldo/keto reductase [Clathrospora elynae]
MYHIPNLGFGVYQSPEDKCATSCKKALEAGYRHIDTAQFYENETQVGRALLESGLLREQVFLTSKILSSGEDVESTYQKICDSVEKLAGKDGYVDLFLIHSPNVGTGPRKMMWQALEQAQERGKVRDIGVSNYGIKHIEEMKEFCSNWPPAVNQIELHPWCQQVEIVDWCERHNVLIEAYSPLVRNKKAEDETIVSIAKKHNKEPNQVLVRWSLQKGFVPLPKSDTPSRIVSNADVYDFNLDEEDMYKLGGLDQREQGAIVQAVSNA